MSKDEALKILIVTELLSKVVATSMLPIVMRIPLPSHSCLKKKLKTFISCMSFLLSLLNIVIFFERNMVNFNLKKLQYYVDCQTVIF